MVGWVDHRNSMNIWEKRKIILSAVKWTFLLFPVHGLVSTRAELFRVPKLGFNIDSVSEPSRLQYEQSLI
jgi:hypothetical protein